MVAPAPGQLPVLRGGRDDLGDVERPPLVRAGMRLSAVMRPVPGAAPKEIPHGGGMISTARQRR